MEVTWKLKLCITKKTGRARSALESPRILANLLKVRGETAKQNTCVLGVAGCSGSLMDRFDASSTDELILCFVMSQISLLCHSVMLFAEGLRNLKVICLRHLKCKSKSTSEAKKGNT